jgi:hypothetical protein
MQLIDEAKASPVPRFFRRRLQAAGPKEDGAFSMIEGLAKFRHFWKITEEVAICAELIWFTHIPDVPYSPRDKKESNL